MTRQWEHRLLSACCRLAQRHAGQCWPNPAVGALIVQFNADNRPVIVGRGATAVGGRPHAEVMALKEAGDAARGATAYVSLEPCAHFGKSPPCAEALIEAGVVRVVFAVSDPDKRVAGKGAEILRAAGIVVEADANISMGESVHAGHLIRMERGRPFIEVKLALSKDGAIGRAGSGQVAITNDLSNRLMHHLRARHDAILVSVATVLSDDPQLTVRLPGFDTRCQPVRIILDRQGRLPEISRLWTDIEQCPLWVLHGQGAVFPVPIAVGDNPGYFRQIPVAAESGGKFDLSKAFALLGEEGLTSILVEPGKRLFEALVTERLVDQITLLYGQKTIGKQGLRPFDGAVSQILAEKGYDIFDKAWHDGDRHIRYRLKENGEGNVYGNYN